jgi:uncharacterized protein YjaG (DUF416 family)
MTDGVLQYDEQRLITALDALAPVSRAIFAALCAERAVPAYHLWHECTGRGDPAALCGALESVWRSISESVIPSNLEHHRAIIDRLIPEEEPWDDVLPYAENAAIAVAYAISARSSSLSQEAVWAARQMFDAVDLLVITRDGVDLNQRGAELRVLQDPVVQAELDRQRRDLNTLAATPARDTAEVALTLRERARHDGRLISWVSVPCRGASGPPARD